MTPREWIPGMRALDHYDDHFRILAAGDDHVIAVRDDPIDPDGHDRYRADEIATWTPDLEDPATAALLQSRS